MAIECFGDRLADAVRRKGTPAIVGIDPRPDLLPQPIKQRHALGPAASASAWAQATEEFCSRVLDVVAPQVPAVKFQSAFFELHGAAGIDALHQLLRKARRLGLLTILDAKRGDIGTTSEAYAEAAFGNAATNDSAAASTAAGWLADALTVSPYLGKDSLEPFLKFAREAGRGLFVLVRTSNTGSRDLQYLIGANGQQPVYRHVAGWVRAWSDETRGQAGYGAVGAVVGGTAGEQIAELRAAMPGLWLLIPGYGAQGATAAEIAAAFDSNGLGALVNNSRGILSPATSASGSVSWEQAVAAALKQMIDDLARHTPAGKLRAPVSS